MKLTTFERPNQTQALGIFVDSDLKTIIDVEKALQTPINIYTLLRDQARFMPALQQLLQFYKQDKVSPSFLVEASTVKLFSPIPQPTTMRDGYAFRQHVEASRRNRGVPMIPEFDLFPIFYYTNHMSVTGPGEVMVQKQALEKLDFELEAAIVIGKEGKNIKASEADEYIFGYTIMNDWSARHLQMEEMKLNLGPAKGKDFATSLGPYILTRDEMKERRIAGPNGERYDLKMKAFLNGKQYSESNLKEMNWTFAQIIERASYGTRLYPGEVIGSGTAGTGCFMELNGSKVTDNLWLKPGDKMVLEIELLGKLENTIVEAPEN